MMITELADLAISCFQFFFLQKKYKTTSSSVSKSEKSTTDIGHTRRPNLYISGKNFNSDFIDFLKKTDYHRFIGWLFTHCRATTFLFPFHFTAKCGGRPIKNLSCSSRHLNLGLGSCSVVICPDYVQCCRKKPHKLNMSILERLFRNRNVINGLLPQCQALVPTNALND